MESREDFDLDVSRWLLVLRRSWLPAAAVFVGVVLLTIGYSTRLKPTYEADAKLLFKIDRTSELTGLEGEGETDEGLKSLLYDQSPLNSEVEVISSRPLLQRTIDQLNLTDEDGNPLRPKDVKETLEVKLIGATDVIQIIYVGNNPQDAADIVNSLANFYVENNTLTSQSEAATARNFITDRLPQSETNVRQAELSLRRFREQNQVVALPEEATSSVAMLKDLDSEIMEMQAAFNGMTARSTSLSNQLSLDPDDAVAVGVVSQSPAVQEVLAELQDLERQLAVEQTRFSEESPIVSRLLERRSSLRDVLQQEVETSLGGSGEVPDGLLQSGELRQTLIENLLDSEAQRLSLASQLTSLQNSKAAYLQRVNMLPRLEQEERELIRRLEAAQSTYETLLTKLQELQVKEQQGTNFVRIIEPAVVPDEPVSSSKIRVLAIGVIVGAMLAIAIVIILEILHALNRSKVRKDRMLSARHLSVDE
ncbi:MAG: GumC family protein [Cyanobacteria bacterium CRU_2_1]|nr:GumC family protein [Cyanobacteria bacterium RU_5_0]NJR59564.1 GumC family protein [Cyanobacteria bacterium CRU_2_1]